MADSILKKARAKRDAALQEARVWEAFIRRYEELREIPPHIASALSAMPELELPTRAAAPEQERQRSTERTLPPDTELAKTVALVDAVLDERGQPVLLQDLYNEVTRRGLAIAGKFPRANLGARLYNAGKYVSVKKTGWWFRDRPFPLRPLDGPPTDAEPKDDATRASNNGELFDALQGNA
jgi:hypothetical protein